MPQIIVNLTEDQDIKVQIFKAKNKLISKAEAIAKIIENMPDL